jgi:hypothetical protein
MRRTALFAMTLALASSNALADPCGMVPPIVVGVDVPITRVGLQKTYVFFKDGIETFVIRPGFEGKAEEFGMLIPFPEPPALRKVSEEIFSHLDKAIDPPEIVIDLSPPPPPRAAAAEKKDGAEKSKEDAPLAVNEVRVLRREAVGMYEVAVLEAGSAAALKRWMDDHGYKYPTGMDAVCEEYIKLRWCFVAEKARVGVKSGLDPKPGVKTVNGKLPPGSTFDGHVQAMGFRFRTKQLIVPMRLSAFNAGELRNVVYLITDGPRRVRSIPEEYVVRQLSGEELFRNLHDPLPLRIINGTVAEIPQYRRDSLRHERNPRPHNGEARELFASDLLAVKMDRLSHPFEEDEKMLLRIGEDLGLRGPEIDKLNLASLAQERDKAAAAAVADLKKMTLTLVDGDFPREVVGGQDIKFAEYTMPARRNTPEHYDAKQHAPVRASQGIRHTGSISLKQPSPNRGLAGIWSRTAVWGAAAMIALIVATLATRKRPSATADDKVTR